jgi:predicted SAM-dependent methyltransferase
MSLSERSIDPNLLLNRLKGVSPWSEMEDGTKFDNLYYLIEHLDVLEHGVDPYKHYLSHGRSEGRKWKAWSAEVEEGDGGVSFEDSLSIGPLGDQPLNFDRQSFAQLAMRSKQILEIGPFTSPQLHGKGVSYADVLDTDALRKQADQMGLEKSGIPKIDFVVSPNNLMTINRKFDTIFSSHVVEHQPDLVSHLNQVSELLNDGGRYFLLIPDHRYCFDHFQTESVIAGVLQAHQENRLKHSMESVINHRVNLTHNDSVLHWLGDHGKRNELQIELIQKAIEDYRNCGDTYLDCHAWYLSPDNWKHIISVLAGLCLIELELEFLQETQRNDIEFYAILRKTK